MLKATRRKGNTQNHGIWQEIHQFGCFGSFFHNPHGSTLKTTVKTLQLIACVLGYGCGLQQRTWCRAQDTKIENPPTMCPMCMFVKKWVSALLCRPHMALGGLQALGSTCGGWCWWGFKWAAESYKGSVLRWGAPQTDASTAVGRWESKLCSFYLS